MYALSAPGTVCTRCGRSLSARRSVGRRYGPLCYARVVRASQALLKTHSAPAHRAAELLLDAGLARLPGHKGRIFRTVSSDGQRTYLTSPDGCNCQGGLHAKLCYHSVAVTILAA